MSEALQPTPLRVQLLNDVANGRIVHAEYSYGQLYGGVVGPLGSVGEKALREMREAGLIHRRGRITGDPVELTLEGKMTLARWCADE